MGGAGRSHLEKARDVQAAVLATAVTSLRGLGVGWLYWPCCQNPGRKPAISRRAKGARDARSLGEQDSTCRATHLIVPGRLRRERHGSRSFECLKLRTKEASVGPLEQEIYDMTRASLQRSGGATSASARFVIVMEQLDKLEKALLRVAAEVDRLQREPPRAT